MMMREVRQSDAPVLAELIGAAELDDNPDPNWIARVILESNHVTLVEESSDGDLIGFVDAFMTISEQGIIRWEVDLLGVHPGYRGRGIANALIAAVVAVGFTQGGETARALVRIENTASLRAFTRCGFKMVTGEYDLFISGKQVTDAPLTAPLGFLIPVSTLTYSGVWVEGQQSQEVLRCAQKVRTKYGWDVAGAVMNAEVPAPDGYERAGRYRWLILRR
jgi:ribosomal protein S18 acetylase RimI-like enzyme